MHARRAVALLQTYLLCSALLCFEEKEKEKGKSDDHVRMPRSALVT
jgi:hypothetical protein